MKNNQLIFYSTPQGNVKVEVIFEEETFWLSQKRISDLFSVDVRTINEHLQNIYGTGELQKDSTIRKFRIVQKEGKRDVAREVDFWLNKQGTMLLETSIPNCCSPIGTQAG